MEFEHQIKSCISEGDVEGALLALKSYADAERPDIANETLLILSRYENYKKEKSLGLINDATELRKIELSILEIIKPPVTSSKTNLASKNQSKPFLAQSFSIIKGFIGSSFIAIAIILFFYRRDIVIEFFKGTKQLSYLDLFTPFLLLSLGVLIIVKRTRG